MLLRSQLESKAVSKLPSSYTNTYSQSNQKGSTPRILKCHQNAASYISLDTFKTSLAELFTQTICSRVQFYVRKITLANKFRRKNWAVMCQKRFCDAVVAYLTPDQKTVFSNHVEVSAVEKCLQQIKASLQGFDMTKLLFFSLERVPSESNSTSRLLSSFSFPKMVFRDISYHFYDAWGGILIYQHLH